MADQKEEINTDEFGVNAEDNIGDSTLTADPLLQVFTEHEKEYKNTCMQEVALFEQLKNVQEKRKALAGQLELIRSLAA
jgi:HPt (histidine-containing phosphotransfer) domain-containing protein